MSKYEEYLKVTAIWCNHFIDEKNLAGCFRPKDFSPSVDFRDFNVTLEDKISELEKAYDIKLSQLSTDIQALEPIGKVLLFYPDRNLGDGLFGLETEGFFSEDDLPPWGTWFYFESNDSENILYCWIPKKIVNIVNKAIQIDYCDCLSWC